MLKRVMLEKEVSAEVADELRQFTQENGTRLKLAFLFECLSR